MSGPAMKEPTDKLANRYSKYYRTPPGLKWVRAMDLAIKYKEYVKDKSKITLMTIAKIYGITPNDLMLFNWNTTKKAEVNWYLHDWSGCRKSDGDYFCFTATSSPGMILVPKQISYSKIGPPRTIAVSRQEENNTHDTGLQVYVQEWLPDGTTKNVEGKWLYVFSGPGLDFGFKKPTPPSDSNDSPGSAFVRDFPGRANLTAKPDTLEYEIFVSSPDGPSADTVKAVTGTGKAGKPRFDYGRKWYFLSDPTVLGKARSQARHERLDKHTLRGVELVNVDLTRDGAERHYYFLLSPVQLGPEGIKSAMENPSGLTPLLSQNAFVQVAGPDDPFYWQGPDPKNTDQNPLTLRVIDPFAWAAYIAEVTFPRAVGSYVDWIRTEQDERVKELEFGSNWPTLDHVYLAEMLAGIMKSYKKGGEMRAALADPADFDLHLEMWNKYLFEETARINLTMHRALLQLLDWMEGPAFAIIETAILKDTGAKNAVDAIDGGYGVLIFTACMENMLFLPAGIDYLRSILRKPDRLPQKLILKDLADVESKIISPKLSDFDKKIYKYAAPGVIALVTLKDVVSTVSKTTSSDQALDMIAKHGETMRDNLTKLFNDQKLLPFQVGAVEMPGHTDAASHSKKERSLVKALVKGGKVANDFVIDASIAKLDKALELNRLVLPDNWYKTKVVSVSHGYEAYIKAEKELRSNFKTNVSNLSKAVSFYISNYNLYSVFSSVKYDPLTDKYIDSAGWTDKANAVASSLTATHSVINRVSTDLGSKWMAKHVPDLEKYAAGKLGTDAATMFGRTLIRVNVVAMVVSGVTYVIGFRHKTQEALDLGNYTAVAYYRVGQVGGYFQIGGGLLVGAAVFLMHGGADLAVTGIFTDVGVVLFAIGSILAALASLLGADSEDDPYVLFTRKCFFGKQGSGDPRFGNSAPPWSLATKAKQDSWTVPMQKRALFNLLGMSTVWTKAELIEFHLAVYRVDLSILVTPGYFLKEFEMEVALHVNSKGPINSVLVKWDDDVQDYKVSPGQGSGIIDNKEVKLFNYSFDPETKRLKTALLTIHSAIYRMDSPGEGEGLWTTVTIRNRGLGVSIGTRKIICKSAQNYYHLDVNNKTVYSNIFTE